MYCALTPNVSNVGIGNSQLFDLVIFRGSYMSTCQKPNDGYFPIYGARTLSGNDVVRAPHED